MLTPSLKVLLFTFLSVCSQISQLTNTYLAIIFFLGTMPTQDRLEAFESAATRILTTQEPAIASWTRPTAGMFLWIKLVLPPTAESDQGDSFDLITNKAKAAGVLALPGVAFKPPSGDGAKKSSAYVRTSFSQVPLDQVDTAFIRLREVVEEAWREAGLEISQ